MEPKVKQKTAQEVAESIKALLLKLVKAEKKKGRVLRISKSELRKFSERNTIRTVFMMEIVKCLEAGDITAVVSSDKDRIICSIGQVISEITTGLF